ncbi:hypothetical protein HIM_00741 [Hirsutella minnesotensis 3608]|nr:hypothetical protein HIM_00741 [Hirsutella minnesotensis 3608]
MASTATVALIGTFDSKEGELLFLRDRIEDSRLAKTLLIDVGRFTDATDDIAISHADLLREHGGGQEVSRLSRGEYSNLISQCAAEAVKELYRKKHIDGIVSAGGSSGTSIASRVMRDALPLGFPKLIISTMAGGNTGPIVGETDIMLMNSIVDVAGLNAILREVLRNGGAAIAAAASAYAASRNNETSLPVAVQKKRVGITMFGVTTPGADAIRLHLESNHPIETFVFHATGNGGRAMERLIQEGKLDAVLDLTTTEICDLVMDGILSAGHGRLDAAAEAGIPNIISLGAIEIANFGPRDSVPEKYSKRRLHEHNSLVTLVRASERDYKEIASFIVSKLLKAKRPDMVEIWIPRGGTSMLAVPGAAFEDASCDEALFRAIHEGLDGSGIKVVDDERHINDEGFARDIADALLRKMGF